MTKNKLPKNWVQCKLEDITSIISGQSPDSSTYNTESRGLPFFQGKAEFGQISPTVRQWCSAPKKIANKDDILMSVRAPVGPTNIADQTCAIGRGLAAIRSSKASSQSFILFFLKLQERIITKMGSGSTFDCISRDSLANLKLNLPPLREQNRIVEKIESLFKDIDAGITTLNTLQTQINNFKESTVRKLISQNGIEYKLGDALIYEQPTKYIVSSTNYDDSFETPVLTPGKSFIKGHTNETEGIFKNGLPVIIFDDFTSANKFVDFPFKVKSSAMKILHSNKRIADIKYLFKILSQIKKTKETHKRYWISEYAHKKITLPSLQEQKAIVKQIEHHFAAAQQMQKVVDDALANAAKLKQSILKKAFAGELVSQDPNDEPAEKLLARIKAERAEGAQHSAYKTKSTTTAKRSMPVQTNLKRKTK